MDASAAEARHAAEARQAGGERLLLLGGPNRGGERRNRGLARVTGEAVCFLDADDPLGPRQARAPAGPFRRPRGGGGGLLHVLRVSPRARPVTRGFGALIDEVNRRSRTSFSPFTGSAAEQRAVEDLIERLNEDNQWRQRRAGRVDDTRTKALPVGGREHLKQERRDELAEPRNQELLARARALYDRYLAARARG